jgi:hypothetical protein
MSVGFSKGQRKGWKQGGIGGIRGISRIFLRGFETTLKIQTNSANSFSQKTLAT